MKTFRVMLAGAAILSSSLAFAQATTSPDAAAAPAAAPTAPAKPAKKLSYTDDYRINVNHDADSDGQIVFQVVTKKDPATKDITVEIKKGTSENHVADAIKKAFVAQLGTKGYSIEMDGDENVIIEGSGGKTYSLVLVSSTVKGVKVSVHHD
jgi:hypothetical protein